MITRLDVINPAKDFSFLFLFPSINTYYPNLSLSLDKVISFIQLKNISILQRLCAKILGKIFDSSTAISMLPCRNLSQPNSVRDGTRYSVGNVALLFKSSTFLKTSLPLYFASTYRQIVPLCIVCRDNKETSL